MRSPNYFIIKPKEGKRYKDTEKIGDVDLILTNNIENHKYTNREGVVQMLPENYKGEVEVGDTLIVHHNTFRLMRSQQNVLMSSSKYIMDDLFYTDDYYLCIDKNGKITTKSPYVFLKPVMTNDIMKGEFENQNVGELVYLNKELEDKGLRKGEIYAFKDFRNYRFNIDGKDYFRMTYDSLLAKV